MVTFLETYVVYVGYSFLELFKSELEHKSSFGAKRAEEECSAWRQFQSGEAPPRAVS